jgi:hypothetical protein
MFFKKFFVNSMTLVSFRYSRRSRPSHTSDWRITLIFGGECERIALIFGLNGRQMIVVLQKGDRTYICMMVIGETSMIAKMKY